MEHCSLEMIEASKHEIIELASPIPREIIDVMWTYGNISKVVLYAIYVELSSSMWKDLEGSK